MSCVFSSFDAKAVLLGNEYSDYNVCSYTSVVLRL